MTRRNGVVLAATAAVALVLTGGVAVATGGGGRGQQTVTPGGVVRTSAGGVCKSGVDTQRSDLVPPDATPNDNPAAGKVVMTKGCAGIATITFSSEAQTPDGNFIHLDFRATCIGTGGYSTHHCQVGNAKFANPGDTYFQNNTVSGLQVQTATEVFTGLSRGKWRFEVLPSSTAGNTTSQLVYRTTVVQAYNGG